MTPEQPDTEPVIIYGTAILQATTNSDEEQD